MRIVLVLLFGVLLAGGGTSSCMHYPIEPQDSVRCDTCDTDTTIHPCDTCGINRDSLSHAFEWKEYSIPGESNLTGVLVFSDTDIRIVGNSFWKFNGTGFQEVPAYNLTFHKPMNGGMNGLSLFGFNKDDYWMVYVSAAFSTNWDGNFYDYRFGPVNACWGPSSKDMFFVGNGGHIYHYNGTAFDTMISPTMKNLRAIWGTNHNDVWACGYNSSTGESILLHYDGISWSEDQISIIEGNRASGGFDAVWSCDSNSHRFVMTCGAWPLRKTDNGSWRSDSASAPNRLSDGSWIGIGVLGNSADDLFIYGGWGFIAHWNGKTWKKYNALFNYDDPIYYTSGFSIKGNTACAVGRKSGTSWIAVGKRKQ